MMMPAPTGTKRGAFSSTVTGSLRNDSSRASERPPIPPPTTSVERLTTAILLKVHGSVRQRIEQYALGSASAGRPRAPLYLRRPGDLRAGDGAPVRSRLADSRPRQPGEGPGRLLHDPHGTGTRHRGQRWRRDPRA